ncbi:MAG: hypothetical protein P0Y59_04880 [Candidatus Sphingomonas phytovorans]|nr:hypothetical protein [Sphingomonas sp.]WEK01032.1 MAG: hypothetical protein P0Y59_04880 [Sphingomonas sp.]
MKFVSTLCATALALAGTAPASAQTFSPVGQAVFEGAVVVQKGLTLNCKLKLTINVMDANTAWATPALESPNILCPTMTFGFTPYQVTFGNGIVTINYVRMNPITPGTCSGNIVGTWGGNFGRRSIVVNANLPDAGLSDPCKITGNLFQVSGSDLSLN